MTEAQLEANRENAKKSTGPKTEEGKQRSSINATRHGLTGQFHAFSEEDRIAFDTHCNGLLSDFDPQSHREMVLAVAIAEDHWRLHRARALENNVFAVHMSTELGEATTANSPEVHTAVTQARTWLQEAHKLQLLTLYETRIRRNIDKNEKQLADLQAARQNKLETCIEKAKLLTKLAAMNGEPYDPAGDFPQYAPEAQNPEAPAPQRIDKRVFAPGHGFVFSAAEINCRLDLDKRLSDAFFHSKNGWQMPKPHERPGVHTPKAA